MIGRVAGNYRITAKLGEGAMGTVYKAVDVMVEREVAIKMLRPEIARQPELLERFRAEAVTLARLNHPSIAMLYSFFRQGEEYFMAMEFVPGQTLDTLLREHGPLAVEPAVRIMAKVLDGIDHAHRQGILHRDIKPANIMLTPAGAVKVTDFGIARVLGTARMTREGNLIGTMEYLAPERIRGQASDLRSDIYSLGAVLYEMLTGRVPFEADTDFEIMRAHLEDPPRPVSAFQPNVPPEVEAAILKALAKNPEERFSTAAEFQEALVASLGGLAAETLSAAVKPTRLSTVTETRLAQEPAAPPPLPGPTATAALEAPAMSLPQRRLTAKHYVAIGAVLMCIVAAVLAVVLRGRREPVRARENNVKAEQKQAVSTPGRVTTPVSLPEDVRPKTVDVLKTATPVTTSIPALGDVPAKKASPRVKGGGREAEERRKASLRALGVEEGTLEKKSEPQAVDDERRKAALKALGK